MFNTSKKSDLQHLRDALLVDMSECDPQSQEFEVKLGQVKTLSELVQKEHPPAEKLSINAVLPAIATVGSVALVIWHERDHVLVTKALNFLPKLI